MNKGMWFISFSLIGASVITAEQISDESLRSAIKDKLENSKLTCGEHPLVSVENGVVLLTGTVKNLQAKRDVIELSMATIGVTQVNDQLSLSLCDADENIGEAVVGKILGYPLFTIYDDINIAINNGNVTLTGRVTMPFKSEEIERRVATVLGVQSINNEIETLPVNIGDQKIRANLSYRIYSDSLFREQGFRQNPPIHIIVERGAVALTGAVRSEVERRKAEHIARSTFGVFSVDNRLTVGS